MIKLVCLKFVCSNPLFPESAHKMRHAISRGMVSLYDAWSVVDNQLDSVYYFVVDEKGVPIPSKDRKESMRDLCRITPIEFKEVEVLDDRMVLHACDGRSMEVKFWQKLS